VCCEQLACAVCSGRVSDGGCPTCRAYRDSHHPAHADRGTYLIPLVAALLAVLLLLALHAPLP